MITHLRALFAEERATDPPARVWRDWVLLVVLMSTAIIEGALRTDLSNKPLSIVVCLALLPTLLWRRTAPLQMMVITFGTIIGLDAIALATDETSVVELYTSAFLLLLPYALFRWGSGQDAARAIVLMAAITVVGNAVSYSGVGDVIGGIIVLLFPAVLGAEVRYMVNYRERGIQQAKLREREMLARELHDTVAHYVSAIAIQAQAGQVVAATDPAAACEALAAIEEQASRTLVEMRTMVGTLRDGSEAELAPQQGIADINRLTNAGSDAIAVDVEIVGDLSRVPSSIDAAVFRLAQESITNAIRHARNASRVKVVVVADPETVRLSVHDDGDRAAQPFSPGFGLLGMTERAKLLGGALIAGPANEGGWTVRAVLPRAGAAS